MNKSPFFQLRQLLAAGAVALILSLGVNWVSLRNQQSPQSNAGIERSIYPEVRSRGNIRAAYYVGAPYFIVDPNSKSKSGIFFETTEAVAKKLGLKVDWVEEVGFGEMAEGIRAKRFDIVASGIWISPERARVANFTTPILYDAVFPYARTDDTRFDRDLTTLNDSSITISTIDGEMAATIAAANFPNAKTLSLPQTVDFTQMILNVLTKKADVTFLALGPANQYLRQNPGQIRNISPSHPTRVFPAAIMLPLGDFEFQRAIDLILFDMLNSGEMDAIIRKYEVAPNSHLRVSPAFATITQ